MVTSSHVLSASSLMSNDVKNTSGEDLGKIEDFMLDTDSGRIVYAVLSFGGFLGLGEKLFAVPMSALRLDTDDKCFRLDTSKESLKAAPGFDKDHWPNMADQKWGSGVHAHYGQQPYWK